jgi:O-acetyl-ADP-ribose deacetylase (regulator of RNase III)
LEECLRDVERFARDFDHASVHMPRIGCGLAGGKWSEVEPILERVFVATEVYIYDFVTGDARTIPWNK